MALSEKRYVMLHGHRVAYRCSGDVQADRPVVLLVHGIAGNSATWNAAMSGMTDAVTVVAPDLPGHGDSDKGLQDYSLGAHANALRDLMVALGIERATVVGHSLGGGVAMQLAYQHPQRCERLVLVSSGGLGSEVSWLLRFMTLPGAEYLMPVIFPSVARDAGRRVGRALAGVGVRLPRIEQEWRAYASLVDPGNRQSFVRTLRSVVEPTGQSVSAHDRLYLAADLPTLIVWGGRDRIIPVSHAASAHAALPGSRVEIFEHAGHFPHTDQPEAFAKVLADFINTTEPLHLDDEAWRALLKAGNPERRRRTADRLV